MFNSDENQLEEQLKIDLVDPNPGIRYGALCLVEDEDILLKYVDDDYPQIRMFLLDSLPFEYVTHYAVDLNSEVRAKFARLDFLSPETLALLSRDEDRNVRAQVAMHKNTPPIILDSLKNNDKFVQYALIMNPRTPKHTISYLESLNDNDLNKHISMRKTREEKQNNKL